MTDAKGDRSKKPHQQASPDTYVHVVERNGKGIVISGTKAIVTGAPYMHELLVMPSRNMGHEDKDFAVCCALRVDEPGVTIISRPAGRPGESSSMAMLSFHANTAKPPPSLFSIVFSCLGNGCSTPANGSTAMS